MEVRGLRADGTLGGTVQAPEILFQMGVDEFSYGETLLEGLDVEGGYALDKGFQFGQRCRVWRGVCHRNPETFNL